RAPCCCCCSGPSPAEAFGKTNDESPLKPMSDNPRRMNPQRFIATLRVMDQGRSLEPPPSGYITVSPSRSKALQNWASMRSGGSDPGATCRLLGPGTSPRGASIGQEFGRSPAPLASSGDESRNALAEIEGCGVVR